MVTTDSDFDRFPELRWQHPLRNRCLRKGVQNRLPADEGQHAGLLQRGETHLRAQMAVALADPAPVPEVAVQIRHVSSGDFDRSPDHSSTKGAALSCANLNR